jgi:hypothetical protein
MDYDGAAIIVALGDKDAKLFAKLSRLSWAGNAWAENWLLRYQGHSYIIAASRWRVGVDRNRASMDRGVDRERQAIGLRSPGPCHSPRGSTASTGQQFMYAGQGCAQ